MKLAKKVGKTDLVLFIDAEHELKALSLKDTTNMTKESAQDSTPQGTETRYKKSG